MNRVERVEKLISLALDEQGNANERSSAAMQAVRLIREHSLLVKEQVLVDWSTQTVSPRSPVQGTARGYRAETVIEDEVRAEAARSRVRSAVAQPISYKGKGFKFKIQSGGHLGDMGKPLFLLKESLTYLYVQFGQEASSKRSSEGVALPREQVITFSTEWSVLHQQSYFSELIVRKHWAMLMGFDRPSLGETVEVGAST